MLKFKFVLFFVSLSMLSKSQNINDDNLFASLDNQIDQTTTSVVPLLKGEFLGTSLLNSVSLSNQNFWNDSLTQNRIADIFKLYYHSNLSQKLKNNSSATLKVHSNANNQNVYLGLSGDILDEVTVVDGSGNIVFNNSGVNKSFTRIDFSTFPSGSYYLQVSGNKEFSTKKVVKQ